LFEYAVKEDPEKSKIELNKEYKRKN